MVKTAAFQAVMQLLLLTSGVRKVSGADPARTSIHATLCYERSFPTSHLGSSLKWAHVEGDYPALQAGVRGCDSPWVHWANPARKSIHASYVGSNPTIPAEVLPLNPWGCSLADKATDY